MAHDLQRQQVAARARSVFSHVPMPLGACLQLRRYLATQDQCEDVLSPVASQIVHSSDQLTEPTLRALLEGIRLGEWALDGETIEWLFQTVRRAPPTGILEFGSGVSTMVLAKAMAESMERPLHPRICSLEQDTVQVERTRTHLAQCGLQEFVRVLHAPLVAQSFDGVASRCYQISSDVLGQFAADAPIDFVLVDGPAAEYGERVGTVPLCAEYIQPGAAVYMDDGLRDSELATAQWWDAYGYLRVDGVLWLGKGLVVARAPVHPFPSSSPARETLTWVGEKVAVDDRDSFSLSPPVRFDLPQSASASQCRSTPPGHVSCASRTPLTVQSASGTCAFLNTYYPGYVADFYRKNPGMEAAPYHVQLEALHADCFGDSDFYSQGLIQQGWKAEDLIVNVDPLQHAWVQEHGSAGRGLEVVVEQLQRMRPDVVYFQDLSLATEPLMSAIRPMTKLIVGQIASRVPPQTDVRCFDILISSFPHFVQDFRKLGITAYYQPLAFDPRVLERVPSQKKRHEVTFVGSMSSDHSARTRFLEQLQALVPFDCWGYQMSPLRPGSLLERQYRGEAWGREMFRTLQDSFMTVNYHVDVAKCYANNMRLFEATGCGALLITDYRDNLQELFDIGTEVIAYRSVEECAELVKYYAAHRDEAARIAQAGQAKTLRDHTYSLRMAHTAEILERHLRYQRERGQHVRFEPSRVSCGYEHIRETQVSADLTDAWKSRDIPAQQRALVQGELSAMYSGRPPAPFQALADCLRPYVTLKGEVLEIGCASGYYYEVLEYMLGKRLAYTGVDYSDAMIELARDYYPRATFHVADGGCLPFPAQQFPLVISSGVLLHVPNYQAHIQEAVRVARRLVVAHRTPVCKQRPTQWYKKFAYGVETVELRFHEKTFLEECMDVGLSLLHAHEYASNVSGDEYEVTYVFRKTP